MKHYILFLMVCTALLCSGCNHKKQVISGLSMLEGGKIFAVPTGTAADRMVLDKFPDAVIAYYNNVLDCAIAVQEGKADAAVYDLPALKNISAKIEGLKVLDELILEDHYGFAVQHDNTELKKAIDETLATIKADGTYEKMMGRWSPEKGDPAPMPEIELTGTNGVLKFGTAAVTEPMSFYDSNRKIVGFDIEFAAYVAQKLGKKLEITDMEFGGMLPALISGKVDMIGAGLSITEERAKSVLFSDSYYPSGIAAMVKADTKEISPKSSEIFTSVEDVKDKKIAVLLGSIHDTYAGKNYPKAEILQYQNVSDMLTALNSDKADVAFIDELALKEVFKNNDQLAPLELKVYTVPIGAGFHEEDDSLRTQFNVFLQDLKSQGIYDDMVRRWMEIDSFAMPEIKSSSVNGTLRVGIVSDIGFPFTAIQNGQPVGFDIELSSRFAAYLGKKFVPVDIQFGSMLASLSTRKIDMITCSMMITEERDKQIDFSDPYIESGVSLITTKKHLAGDRSGKMTVLNDIADKRIGIYTGTVFDKFIGEEYPEAEIFRYENTSDMMLSVKSSKVDAIMLDLHTAKILLKHNPDLVFLSEDVLTMPLGMGFRKDNTALRDEYNHFLKEIKADGTYDVIYKRWFVDNAEEAVMPKFENKTSDKKLIAGVSVDDLPYVAFMNGEYVGFDIELIQKFAERNQYELEFVSMAFPSLIAALSSGKVNIIADGIAISEERQKQVDFSDSYADFSTGVVISKKNFMAHQEISDNTVKKPIFKAIAEGFYNNIVFEKRYLLIIEGLKVTMLISIFAALIGTLFGGLICFMRMSKKKVLLYTAKGYISLLRGTPVLVLLMIIYYIVFASVNISPVLVSMVAFGLNFAAYVSEMFRTSIESIDKGQKEAGIAGGFTKIQTFIFIIMPQALQHVLPVYKGEFISLVKATSIVGYIAVQDLTKASDIIRSRTFDAFFPLIMAAVLYLIIAWLLTWALSYVEVSVDPKRKRIQRIQEANK